MTHSDIHVESADTPSSIQKLLNVMTALRDPETGCEWDIRQTFKSIMPYTIEEAYEVGDAIERDDMVDLCDELGDLLLQVVYHAQIATENGDFTFDDVVEGVTQKMLRRHPHVFGTLEQRARGMQKGDWERIKAEERKEKAKRRVQMDRNQAADIETPRLLNSVSMTLPALNASLKLQKKAASIGFDWKNIDLVWNKMHEEMAELALEMKAETTDHERLEDEMGDILFVAVNIARHLGLDPEICLRKTNHKFINRFNYLEDKLKLKYGNLSAASLDEMDALWNEAKAAGIA